MNREPCSIPLRHNECRDHVPDVRNMVGLSASYSLEFEGIGLNPTSRKAR
ncbi:hypothetical protein Cenrod_0710 [Candidatus Symbiobacter mobilis CR]|uniref:Uncharacterized protein n=1 Tax=Candidatus Symbiobacter mobilis CR TaxID=946483 RepID=U5N621_9BURK|nr:hypothetical protein Cenrod_0710 [Candidatus Symbiobacter mobilis CR]